jgi:hypothetical protein
MEGTAVMLPQHAPYTDPVEILVCGGSTPIEADALDNCLSIAPEVPNATWTLERSVRASYLRLAGCRLIRIYTAVQARDAVHGSWCHWRTEAG